MKSKISHSETLRILEIAFTGALEEAREAVFDALEKIQHTEPEFFDAIEVHTKGMNLTSEQWLRIFQIYRSPILRKRFDIHKLLSANDQKKLADYGRV